MSFKGALNSLPTDAAPKVGPSLPAGPLGLGNPALHAPMECEGGGLDQARTTSPLLVGVGTRGLERVYRYAFPDFYGWQRAFGSRPGGKEEDFETRSVLGRRRVVAPDASGKPKYTDRLNGPIQTTGVDVLYRTLKRLMKDQDESVCSEATFLFSSHDEIVFECPETSKEEVIEWLGRRMREVLGELIGDELAGPTSVEVACGQSWADHE